MTRLENLKTSALTAVTALALTGAAFAGSPADTTRDLAGQEPAPIPTHAATPPPAEPAAPEIVPPETVPDAVQAAAPEPAPAPEPPPPPPPPSVPLENNWITNPFGWRDGVNPLLPAGVPELHNGIDFGADTGTPIRAVKPGTVTYAEFHQYGGLRTVIDHGDGTQSTYSHQNEQWVHAGDHVEFGQTIGTVGTTGNSTGPHLHFEYWENGVEVDPAPIFDSF